MADTHFTATLLRTSANGFAGLAMSRTAERSGRNDELEGGFQAWQAHLRTLVLELAAAVDDGSPEHFANRVGWTRDAFMARNLETDLLAIGLEELGRVLEDSLPSEAWEPLPGFLEAAREELRKPSAPGATPGPAAEALDTIVDSYLAAIDEGDGTRAIEVVMAAIRENRVSIPDALDGVLTLALREIGRRWHADEMNIAEEHFATQTTGRLLEQIVFGAPKPSSYDRAVVLSMVEGDVHDLGIRIVAAFFELDGWRTICLGGNTPAPDLAGAVQKFDPDLVLLGATLNTHRDAVGLAIDGLKALRPDQRILIGGPAFVGLEGRAAALGASGCAISPRDAIRLGRELLEA